MFDLCFAWELFPFEAIQVYAILFEMLKKLKLNEHIRNAISNR